MRVYAMVLGLWACTVPAGEGQKVSAGIAHATCGPADGPAVRLVLGDEAAALAPHAMPAGAFVEMVLNASLDRARGRSFRIDSEGRGQRGTAWVRSCSDAERCEVAASGRVDVRRVEVQGRDSVVHGWVDLSFPVAGRTKRSFRVGWRAVDLGCI